MDEERNDRVVYKRHGIKAMWLNWVISAGSLMIAFVLTRVVTKQIYPLICLLLCVALYLGIRENRKSTKPVCFALPFITARTLFFSAIVMMIMNILHRRDVIDLIFTNVDLRNPEIPYISMLVIFPLEALFSFIFIKRGRKNKFCQECIRRYGKDAERGSLGGFYSREGDYQANCMFWISLNCSIIGYIYYFFFYRNIHFDTPDVFCFVVAPCIIFFASIIFISVRYLGVWNYIRIGIGEDSNSLGRVSKVRFLIFCDEKLLLKLPDMKSVENISEMRIDTAVKLDVRRKNEVTLDQACEYFRNITGLKDFKMKYLYSNNTQNSDFNIFHFFVELPSKKIPEGARLTGEWFNIHEVVDFLNSQSLNPLLSAEIVRLHRIIMAWKVYDENGMRRYKIRNYKPLFRLRDIAESTLDFNDLKWLYVAENNQDKPFFRLRRFWGRHISRSERK